MRPPLDIARDDLAAWNAASEAECRRRLEGWSAEVRYHDPMLQADGREAMAGTIARARSRFPGHGFALRGTPDGHGPFVRFSWALSPEGGPPVAAGTDVVRLDDEGRIAEVIGFLDGASA